MSLLRSWRALLVREYLEHRIAFLYFPAGILLLLTISSLSGLFTNRVRLTLLPLAGNALKLFEIGDLLILALWYAYLCITLFFYFGDAFAADRRNNAMFFWKSMPVSDLRILASKFLAGVTLFPIIVFIAGLLGGLVLFGLMTLAGNLVAGFPPIDIVSLLTSYGQIAAFAAAYLALALLWYAPFLAWVGGLSTIFGRWSLPLAFVIPGLAAVVENLVAFGNGPRGGYIWSYLSQRWQFGLTDSDYGAVVLNPVRFNAGNIVSVLILRIDWLSLGAGLVFAAIVIWAASEYRRRRLN
jgi:ABC-2 type transport system permease protein